MSASTRPSTRPSQRTYGFSQKRSLLSGSLFYVPLPFNRDFRYGLIAAPVTASTEPPIPSASSSALPNTSTTVILVNPAARCPRVWSLRPYRSKTAPPRPGTLFRVPTLLRPRAPRLATPDHPPPPPGSILLLVSLPPCAVLSIRWGCHASRSMRRRIFPKRVSVKWLSASFP